MNRTTCPTCGTPYLILTRGDDAYEVCQCHLTGDCDDWEVITLEQFTHEYLQEMVQLMTWANKKEE